MQEFKRVMKKGIQLSNRKLVNTILYTDDQILIATSEDELQTITYHLNLITRKYKMTISSTKTKSMALWGNHIQRVKIVINDNIIKQVTYFKYLGVLYIRIQKWLDELQTYNKKKWSCMKTFWKTNEQRNKIKSSQHYS